MSAELLNLLRNGSAASPGAPGQPTQEAPRPAQSPALELLFRDLQSPPMSMQPPQQAGDHSANLLSLLQGLPSPTKPAEPAGLSPLPASKEQPQSGQEALDDLWKMLSHRNDKEPAQPQPTLAQEPVKPAPAPETPKEEAVAPQAAPPFNSPFKFFSGFDVLAARTPPQPDASPKSHTSPELKPEEPLPQAQRQGQMRHQQQLGRVSSPLRTQSPRTETTQDGPMAQHRRRTSQQLASPSSSVPQSPATLPKNVAILQKPAEGPQDAEASGTTAAKAAIAEQQVPEDFLSAKLLDQLPQPAEDQQPSSGELVPSTTSSDGEQDVSIDISHPRTAALYRGPRTVTPITLFATPHAYSIGRKLDIYQSIILYATRTGRLRVLDRSSGARLLLKGHNGPVADLCITSMPHNSDQALILSASTAEPRIALWAVARQVGAGADLPQGYSMLLSFSPKQQSSLRCIRQLKSDLFVFITDYRLLLLDLSGSAWAEHKARGEPASTEEDLMASGLLKQVKFADPIVDLQVSPVDGSAVLVLDAAGHLHIGEITAERSLKPKHKAVFAARDLKAEELCLLHLGARRFCVAISYEQGRVVQLVDLRGRVLASITVSHDGQPQNFGRLSFNSTFNTLMLSSSLRGSVYAFHVVSDVAADSANTDLQSLLTAAASSQQQQINTARITRMLEVPCPKHTLEYVDATGSQDERSLFCVQLDGISQMRIDSDALAQLATQEMQSAKPQQQRVETDAGGSEAVQTDNDGPQEAPLKTDFKDAIAVDVELAVATDHESASGSPRQRARSLPQVTAPPFISSLKSRPSATSQRAVSQPLLASAAAAAPGMSEQLMDLEERLFARVEKLITDREVAQEQRTRHERAAEQAAEIARQEKLLAMVSQTLSKQTNRTLASSIHSEIRDSLLPAISQTVKESVDAEVGNVLRASLQTTVPETLGNVFNRPEVMSHLIRSFSSAAAPVIERSVSTVISNTVLPHLSQQTQQLVDTLSRDVRNEILHLRKEMESEQNLVLADLSHNVVQVRDMMHQAETRSLSQNSHPQPQASYKPRSQAEQTTSFRSSTPPTSYEDMLLDALSDENDSRLVPFIENAPDRRIQTIFASGARPVISQAVILSLMHRLVRSLPARQGPLDQSDQVRLRWFGACLDSLDFGDSTTTAYIPRVFEASITALSSCHPRLMLAGDAHGLQRLNSLIQTLQYKLGNQR